MNTKKTQDPGSAAQHDFAGPIRRRLLIPLTCVLLLIAGAVSLVLSSIYKTEVERSGQHVFKAAAEDFSEELVKQSQALAALEEVILHAPDLRDALKRQDRQALLAKSRDIYNRLHQNSHITHYYFHNAQRVNLLRVHKPERHGDLINRFTAREAERSGKTAAGIELGPLGTFTLRVVQPVFDGDLLIGYFELGKEIEEILANIHLKQHCELAVSIRKEKLDRAQWEKGMAMLGRESEWDRFANEVLIYSTLPRFPGEWDTLIPETGHKHREKILLADLHEKSWYFRASMLTDVSGAEVGDLFVFLEVSEIKASFHRRLLLTLGTILTILALLVSSLYIILLRSDRGIKKQQQALRDKEHFQEQLLNDMLTFVGVLDPTGQIIFVNNTPLKVGGFELKDVVGKMFFDAPWWTHSDDVQTKIIADIKLCADGQSLAHDVQIRVADGSLMWIEFSIHPIFDDRGKVQYLIPEGRDISDRKESEVALAAAKEQAEAASRSKDEFLANMSHEIRTPMNAIVGFTDMALATDLTNEQQEFIQAVNHGCDTLLALINDILDFSKIEAGKLEIDHLEFDLHKMIAGFAAINQGRVAEKGLEFVQRIPPLERMLTGDPARLQQILTNLIGNAVKFTSEGRISLEVEVREETGEKIHLYFAVTDTGIGIAKEKQAAIFKAFTQEDGSVTRDFGGTGLGLTISNQLVALLGGTKLQVNSQQGKGSSFSFELPFTLGDKISLEPDRPEKNEEKEVEISACRILLVEDNLVNIKLATTLLAKQGHRVSVAENGRLGVEAASKGEFDLILMDMMMPEMDGLTATREIRRQEKEGGTGKNPIPIIAMTANAMKGDREKCIAAGMDDYLTKPIKLEIFNQVVGPCLTDRKNNTRSHAAAQTEACKTALVVDDNLVNCKLLEAGLKRENYEVLIVHNGQQAVDMYQEKKIDVILMDIQMPVMDGFAATRQIRKLEAEHGQARIPIIAVTAHARQEDCLAAGMDMSYEKPVKIAKLILVIENLLERKVER